MQGWLTALLECSVSMSVLILCFIALTPWLSKRYSAKWLYYAWLVIIIGLIIPYRFHPDTALIKMDATPSYIQQIMTENAVNTADAAVQTQAVLKEFTTITWYQIAGCIWVAGVIVFIIYHGRKHFRFIKMVNRWGEQTINPQVFEALQRIKSDIGIAKEVRLQICSSVSSPMVLGFISPVIILPQADFSMGELSHILRHELVHLKRKDLWYKSLVFIAAAIHWFNPVSYLMAKAIAAQCEISCDAEVVKNSDMGGRQQYCETIIGVIKNQSRMQTAFSTNFYGGKKGMKNRIFSIMDTTKKKAGVIFLCLILIGTVCAGVAFAANNDTETNAYSTSIPISAKEQERLDQQHREELTKQYAAYEKYGLTYDKTKDCFYYDGKLVRFFSDKLDENGTHNAFTRTNGIIDLKAVRNTKSELTGIIQVSQEEYNKHTESLKRAQIAKAAEQENVTAGNISDSAGSIQTAGTDESFSSGASAYSEGDPHDVEASLDPYLDYGVSYDKANDQWMFNNKPIHFLSDGENMTFVNNGENAVKNGILLRVVRKTGGEIDKIVVISEKEMDKLLNN